MISIITLVLLLLCFSYLSLSKDVHQDPPLMLSSPQSPATIGCSHSISGYYVILWYQKPIGGSALNLIGYIANTSPTLENEFEDRFRIKGDGSKKSELEVQPEDSSMYYCAASRSRVTGASEAYFGGGTKLTVLDETPVTPPAVKILQPSESECKDKKGKKKKTLVCVASGFYPDHVSVSWKRNNQKITDGVSTDAAAKKDGDYYKITSRLTVPIRDWLKPNIKFKCIVSFFNGTANIERNDTLITTGADKPGMTRESYLKITQHAKLSYSTLIVKSCLYAALVCLLVWKLQGKRGKQTK